MPREIETYKTVLIENNFTPIIPSVTITGFILGDYTLTTVNTNITDFKDDELQAKLSGAAGRYREKINEAYDVNVPAFTFTYTDLPGPTWDYEDLRAKLNDLITQINAFLTSVHNLLSKKFSSVILQSLTPITADILEDTDNMVDYIFNVTTMGELSYALEYYGNLSYPHNILNKDIYIEFKPDEVVLKYITINNPDYANCPKLMKLNTNMLQKNRTLITFPSVEVFNESVDIPFSSNLNVNGNYYFSILDQNNLAPANTSTFKMYLAITLLFIKFKSN